MVLFAHLCVEKHGRKTQSHCKQGAGSFEAGKERQQQIAQALAMPTAGAPPIRSVELRKKPLRIRAGRICSWSWAFWELRRCRPLRTEEGLSRSGPSLRSKGHSKKRTRCKRTRIKQTRPAMKNFYSFAPSVLTKRQYLSHLSEFPESSVRVVQFIQVLLCDLLRLLVLAVQASTSVANEPGERARVRDRWMQPKDG